MSKIISFLISDRCLDKLRSLYPDLTDNLAAKQFLTDQLDAGLDDSLDSNLYESYSEIFIDKPDDSLDEEPVTLEEILLRRKMIREEWQTLKEILGQGRKDWPKSIEGLRKKAIREGWPRRDRENRKEYQIPVGK